MRYNKTALSKWSRSPIGTARLQCHTPTEHGWFHLRFTIVDSAYHAKCRVHLSSEQSREDSGRISIDVPTELGLIERFARECQQLALTASGTAQLLGVSPINDLPNDVPRCPFNASGPFYTLGYCLACGLPEGEAPDLLAPLENGNHTTYFIKQPRTPEEIERACKAIQVCCMNDLRYGGQDPEIIQRLGNYPEYCDFLIRGGTVIPASSVRYTVHQTSAARTRIVITLKERIPVVALTLTLLFCIGFGVTFFICRVVMTPNLQILPDEPSQLFHSAYWTANRNALTYGIFAACAAPILYAITLLLDWKDNRSK